MCVCVCVEGCVCVCVCVFQGEEGREGCECNGGREGKWEGWRGKKERGREGVCAGLCACVERERKREGGGGLR